MALRCCAGRLRRHRSLSTTRSDPAASCHSFFPFLFPHGLGLPPAGWRPALHASTQRWEGRLPSFKCGFSGAGASWRLRGPRARGPSRDRHFGRPLRRHTRVQGFASFAEVHLLGRYQLEKAAKKSNSKPLLRALCCKGRFPRIRRNLHKYKCQVRGSQRNSCHIGASDWWFEALPAGVRTPYRTDSYRIGRVRWLCHGRGACEQGTGQ